MQIESTLLDPCIQEFHIWAFYKYRKLVDSLSVRPLINLVLLAGWVLFRFSLVQIGSTWAQIGVNKDSVNHVAQQKEVYL